MQRGAEPIERLAVLEIAGHERRLPAEPADLVVEFFERTLCAGQRHDMGSGAGQGQRGRAADATGCTRHESQATVEGLSHEFCLNAMERGRGIDGFVLS